MLLNKLNDILNTTNQDHIYHVICKFVKDHIEQMSSMSIDEVAQGCYVSKSMITKFIHRLGYENYKEFKYDCALMNQALDDAVPFYSFELEGVKEHAMMRMKKLTYAEVEVLKHIDYNQLNTLVEDLLVYRNIIVLGHGASKISCEILQHDLAYTKIPVLLADTDFENVHFSKDALILIISANGNLFHYRERLVNKLNHLPQKKWLITCKDDVLWDQLHSLYIPSLYPVFNDEIVQFIIKIITNECYSRYKVHKS